MMTRARAVALAMLLAGSPLAAQMPPGMAELRAEQAKMPAPDAVVRYGTDDLRSGEIRLPKGKGRFPVAMLIHGGCRSQEYDTVKGMTPLAEALRQRGSRYGMSNTGGSAIRVAAGRARSRILRRRWIICRRWRRPIRST